MSITSIYCAECGGWIYDYYAFAPYGSYHFRTSIPPRGPQFCCLECQEASENEIGKRKWRYGELQTLPRPTPEEKLARKRNRVIRGMI
jgi:hypothetical protein